MTNVLVMATRMHLSHRFFTYNPREKVPGTFAFRAFFVAVISGCLTVNAFDPIKVFDGNCVNTAAALLANGFGTTTVCDSHVVTNSAALCTTRNR
jgi:hypothetical protein